MTITKKKKADGGKKAPKTDATAEKIESNIAGIAQAGLLMACADGELEESELEVIAVTIHGVLQELGIELTGDQFGENVEQLVNELAGKDLEQMLKLVSSKITEPDVARLAVGVAAVVMVSDEEFDEKVEGPLYIALAAALGFDEKAAEEIYNEYLSAE
jgi:tellurite resistance protein